MKILLAGAPLKPVCLVFTFCLLFTWGTTLLAQNSYIARAQFTTGITAREPDDSIAEISKIANKVYFFSELINMTGSTVLHRWIYNDSVAAEVVFNVNGPRWRVYSSKQLENWMVGDWHVEIVIDDKPQNDKYALNVSETPVETYSSAPSTEKIAEIPAEIIDLQMLFPDTRVALMSADGNTEACPPADHFKWQNESIGLWHYKVAGDLRLPVYLDSESHDQSYSTTKGDCVLQTKHQLNSSNSELIVENTNSCINAQLPVLSVSTLTRKGDELDLLIFADSMSHCRYRLTR